MGYNVVLTRDLSFFDFSHKLHKHIFLLNFFCLKIELLFFFIFFIFGSKLKLLHNNAPSSLYIYIYIIFPTKDVILSRFLSNNTRLTHYSQKSLNPDFAHFFSLFGFWY